MRIIVLISTALLLSCTAFGKVDINDAYSSPFLSTDDRTTTSIPDHLPSFNTIVADENNFQKDLGKYQELVEASLVWRAKAINFHNEVSTKQVLSNMDLIKIHNEGTTAYMNIRYQLMKIVDRYKWTISKDIKMTMTAQKTALKRVLLGLYKYNLKINPNDRLGKHFTKGIKMSLAAGLLLADNYILAISRYNENKKLRKIIDNDHLEISNLLKEITRNYNNPFTVKALAKAIRIFKKERAWEINTHTKIDAENEYFNEIIEGSFIYSKSKHHKKNIWQRILGWIGFAHESVGDYITNHNTKITNEISKVFGNSVGMIQSRHGKLYGMSKPERTMITSKMRALDIILEKTPFRLTDKFIPGHWGHVAIWTGSEEELKELGVWNELPEIYAKAKALHNYKGVSFQEAVRSGRYIIEALRPGVQINTLKHFLEIDDLGVIRHTDLSDEKKREYLIHAFEQIGKDYDFNFDVETDKKIVCSELAYVVYNEMVWPTENSLGRQTISPDNIAVKVKNNGGPFVPVLLYYDGKQINESLLDENFEHLLNLEYDQIEYR